MANLAVCCYTRSGTRLLGSKVFGIRGVALHRTLFIEERECGVVLYLAMFWEEWIEIPGCPPSLIRVAIIDRVALIRGGFLCI